MEQLMIPELETPAPAKARQAWPLVKLGDVCEINPRHPKNLDPNLLVSFVPMQSISETSKSVISEDIRPYAEVSKSYTPFEKGDVLLAKITPCFENGKVAIANISRQYGTGSSEFHVFRPKIQELLATEFLYYAFQLKSFINDAAKNMTGSAGQKRVPKSYLESYQIPLPPLAEQQRIVARLDLAQRLVDQRKAQLALMDQLVQSLFYEMFGDPVKNEMGWEIKKISDICTVTSGGTPDRKQASYFNGDIPWIKTGDLKQKYIKSSEESISGEGLENSSAKIFPVNTVLIALYGATIGACGILRISAATNQACGAILPTSKAIPEYIYHFLFSRRQYFISQGVGGAQPNISGSILKATSIPIPPLPLQQTFADRVQQIETLKQQMQVSLAELEQGFQALMQEAFGH